MPKQRDGGQGVLVLLLGFTLSGYESQSVA
jgi:hypothetical protein